MIAFRASACVIALDLQAWSRLRNLARAQRTIAHDYRPEADALSSASGIRRRLGPIERHDSFRARARFSFKRLGSLRRTSSFW
jgi:hypothetical protein